MATLDDKPFDQAVRVHGRRAGQVRNIGSARERRQNGYSTNGRRRSTQTVRAPLEKPVLRC
jgi:hypothetical protein